MARLADKQITDVICVYSADVALHLIGINDAGEIGNQQFDGLPEGTAQVWAKS
jgi:hypothetical protein